MTCPCREALERAARRCEELQVNRPSDPLANAFDGACRTCAREIRALPPCGRCDTHVMVPEEPTEEMIKAFFEACDITNNCCGCSPSHYKVGNWKAGIQAMLTAKEGEK